MTKWNNFAIEKSVFIFSVENKFFHLLTLLLSFVHDFVEKYWKFNEIQYHKLNKINLFKIALKWVYTIEGS